MRTRRYRALLIGNWHFPDDPANLPDLKGPLNDVSRLGDSLTDPEVGLFAKADVSTVTERLSHEITASLERLLGDAGRDDVLFIYYSGHGLRADDGTLLLCGRNARTDSRLATTLSVETVSRMLRGSAAGAVILVLDCCYSGSFKSGDMADELAGRGRFVLTASRPAERAADAEHATGLSRFTGHLIRGLRGGAGSTAADYVTVSDLYRYVHRAMTDDGPFVPQRRFDGDGDIPLARRHAEEPVPPLATPSELSVTPTEIAVTGVTPGERPPTEYVAVHANAGGWTAQTTAEWLRLTTHERHLQVDFVQMWQSRRANIAVRELTTGEIRVVRVAVTVAAHLVPEKAPSPVPEPVVVPEPVLVPEPVVVPEPEPVAARDVPEDEWVPAPPRRQRRATPWIATAVACAVVASAATVAVKLIGQDKGGTDTGPSSPGAPPAFQVVDTATGPAPAVPGARSGGTVTVRAAAAFEREDPQVQYSYSGQAVYTQLLMRTLTGFTERVAGDGKVTRTLVGDLATDTGQTSDCKTWTYRLRDGLKYEDGTPITAADVAYGISRAFDATLSAGPPHVVRYLAGGTNTQAYYKGPFEKPGTIAPGIKTPDAKTLVFTLPRAHCDFPLAATQNTTVPVPKAKDTGPEKYRESMVASGPYRIKSWDKDKLYLDRNEYWDPNTDPVRHAYPDEFVFDLSSGAGEVSRFITDAGDDKTALMWESAPTDATIPSEAAGRLVQGDTVFSSYMYINTARVKDLNVRRALNYAFDRQGYQAATGFRTRAATTITNPTTVGFKSYDAYPAGPTGDVEKAKSLLNGAKPKLKYCYANTAAQQKGGAAVKTALERGGFAITLAPIESGMYYGTVDKKGTDCDLIRGSWGSDFSWNSTAVGTLMRGGTSITPTGNNNLSYLDVPSVTAEVDRLDGVRDLASAADGYMALDKKIMEEYAPVIPIGYGTWYSLYGSRIGGLHQSPTWGFPSFLNVYIKG